MEPFALLNDLMYAPIANMSCDAEQHPHAEITRNEQEDEEHVIWPIADQGPEQRNKRQAGRQHHGSGHQGPAHDKNDDQHGVPTSMAALVCYEPSIRGLSPEPEGKPGKGDKRTCQDYEKSLALFLAAY